MLQMHYRTALLAVLVLAASGLGYFVEPNSSPDDPPPAPAKRSEDKQVRNSPPVVVEVIAAYPDANAEEVERQVTVPLEVAMAGIPRLQTLRSRSIAGLSWLHLKFEPGTDFHAARQEAINRLQFIRRLPTGVSPIIGPGPGGETLLYFLVNPRDEQGRAIYTLNDMRSFQDWHLEREFRRLPGVIDVVSGGGTVKRYAIVPDPDRLRRYEITLSQLIDVVARSNANVTNDLLVRGQTALTVRSVGLFGGGVDPVSAEVLKADPSKASKLLRAAEQRRLHEIRSLVIASVNNQPIRVEDVVEGGRVPKDQLGEKGVVVGHQPRLGRVAYSGPETESDDVVQGIVLMRQGEDPKLLRGVKDRIRELNSTAGKLLPGVRIAPYYDDTSGALALWVYGTFPQNVSPERMAENARSITKMLREFPEVERVVAQVGKWVEYDLQSPNQLQLFVGLKAGPNVPVVSGRDKPRSRPELLKEFNNLLSFKVPDGSWLTTTKSPEELGLIFPGAPAEHLLKILGPDLVELERLAESAQTILRGVPGIDSVAAYRSLGQSHLEFRIDPDKCSKWGVTAADVTLVVQTAIGKPHSQMIEGEKLFDLTVRWPLQLRNSQTAILDIPIDVVGPKTDIVPNKKIDPPNPIPAAPRLLLRDLVSPIGKNGEPDPKAEFVRAGAATIYREQGTRLIPVRFSLNGRSVADVRAEAAKKIAPLLKAPYRIEWSD